MSWGSPEFVIAIIALSTVGWIVNNWIRARHGYPMEDEWGGKTEKSGDKQARDEQSRELLAQNRELIEKMEAMQDRMIVLERIVTDKGYTVAEEIEALRDTPSPRASDTGVPLNMPSKDRV